MQRTRHPRSDALGVLDRKPKTTARRGLRRILGAVEAKIAALAEDPRIHRRRVRVKAAGRLSLLPLSTVAVIRKAEEATAGYDAMTLTIAVAYGGREEIADAVAT